MDQNKKKWTGRIIFLIVIILITIYILIWSGTIRCRVIPGGCNIYWGIQTLVTGKNQPSVLILYDPTDSDAMGDPELLKDVLSDRKLIGATVNLGNINYLSPDQLKNTSLVIVDKARKVSTLQLLTFIDYVGQGGRLVWIGDSGTIKGQGDQYFDSNSEIYPYNNGWVRVTENNTLLKFNEFIGVNYVTNFCDLKECGPKVITGKLVSHGNSPLIFGLNPNLQIYDNYSIVKTIDSRSPVPLKIDYSTNLFDNNQKSYGSVFPAIVTTNSNRVAYYAIPPEYLVEEDDKQKFISIISNMFDGMVN